MKKPSQAYVIVLILLFAVTGLEAQLGRSLQASWVHFDKAFYVTGDQLGFQLYLAPEFAEEDILVQSILFGANGEAVLYNYWRQGDEHVQGQFTVPEELPTGWYYLSFRAWDESRRTERVLQQAPLAIYNDQRPILPEEVSQQEPARETAQVEIPERELQIEIASLPTGLNPEQGVELDVTITDRRGRPVKAQCSVSINDWGLLSTSLAMGMDNLQASDSLRVVTPDRLSSRFYWPGKMLNAEGGLLSNQMFSMQAQQERQQLSSDERGRFVFQSNQRMVQQLGLDPADDAQIQFQPAAGRLALGRLFYSPAAFRYLETNRQRKAVHLMMSGDEESAATTNMAGLSGTDLSLVAGTGPQNQGWHIVEGANEALGEVSGWYPGLETDADGRLQLSYTHTWEKTAYRIDIVAQDEQGRRGRSTLVYRVPAN